MKLRSVDLVYIIFVVLGSCIYIAYRGKWVVVQYFPIAIIAYWFVFYMSPYLVRSIRKRGGRNSSDVHGE